MTYAENVKNALNSVIQEMENSKEMFVKNPGKDFIRSRKLTFQDTIKLVLSMKGGSLNKELYGYFEKDPERIPSSSALIQQRDKLQEGTFEYLFYKFNRSMIDFKTYKGYKLYAVDGSDINVAYDEQSNTFVKPATKVKMDGTTGRGFNQIHLNAIYDLLNKVYVDAYLQPRPSMDERKALIEMMRRNSLSHRTLYICDRGYPSWNLFAHFKYKENSDFLIRYPNDLSKLTRDLPLEELDIQRDIIVTTNPTYANKEGYVFIHVKKNIMKNRDYTGNTSFVEWNFGMFEKLSLRILRFKISEDTYETIITSLPKEKFSLEEIKKLYAMRWGIETSFRELKYIIGLTNLHSKREDFVVQEIFARLTMYNYCERILQQVVIEQDENRKYEYRVNFTMSMGICIDYFKSFVKTEDLDDLFGKYIVPVRPGRTDKRKIKPKGFVSFLYRVA